MQLSSNNANPIAKSWDFRELEQDPKTSTEGKKKSKASDWTEEETRDTLELWGPKYDKLRSVSNKERVKKWNDIFVAYKEKYPDSERTLPQVKKLIQNLKYEYKLLKQRSQSTGEAGFKKIKEGFPHFDFLDDVKGYLDSVDPSKMAIEGSSTFASEDSSNTSASPQLQESSNDTEENPDDELQVTTWVKRKATDKSAKSARKGKKPRRDEQQTEWQTSFLQLKIAYDLSVPQKCFENRRGIRWSRQMQSSQGSRTFSKI